MNDTLQFNNYATEFLEKMMIAFPDETKIQTYLFSLKMMKMINPKKPVDIFMESLEPFGLQIMLRDEDFFKKDQYINNVESISGKIGIVDHWNFLDSDTKNSIWEYTQTLYILGMSVLGRNDEFKEIMNEVKKNKSKS